MNKIRNLLLAGMIIVFYCSIGNAQIIYSNAFNGGAVNINGTAPTVAANYAGGASLATWLDAGGTGDTNAFYANGNVGTAQGDSILLPFFPQSGYVYTLTASITFSADPGNWVGAGFAQSDAVAGIGNAQFNQTGINGYDWAILNDNDGNVQYFAGPGTTGPIFNQNYVFAAGAGTHTLDLTLDTTTAQWVITCSVDGVQAGTDYTMASAPIAAVGITQHTLSSPSDFHWNYLTLEAVEAGSPAYTLNATVGFSPTNTGQPLNPAFCGLSYEKLKLTTTGYFSATNTALINLFSMIGPAVLRIGGDSVDTTCWGGLSNLTAITTSEVDAFAGFVKALPANWSVIYGINFAVNNPTNCAAEATDVANALGPRLLGFEIGNEPDVYQYNGMRPSGYTLSQFLSQWRPLAAAITNTVPGWAITNGGSGWTLTGPASAFDTTGYTMPFAGDEAGVISLLTQHYYLANGQLPTSTMQLLLQPDTNLLLMVTNIVPAAVAAHCAFGARIDECGSFSSGGASGVSDAYGAALWSLDYMFTLALNGCQGINFHGGGGSPYSPLMDNGTVVTSVGPEFYGLKMFSLLPPGNVIPASLSPSRNPDFTAYGVRQAGGAISVLLNNKNTNDAMMVSVNLGASVSGAQLIELSGPSLNHTSGFILGGATINPDGSWNGGIQTVLPATNGLLNVFVPPISAYLLNPVVTPPKIAASANGSRLALSWPTNYLGWLLQSNSIGLATTNWFTVTGSSATNSMQFPIQLGQSNVFYRLLP